MGISVLSVNARRQGCSMLCPHKALVTNTIITIWARSWHAEGTEKVPYFQGVRKFCLQSVTFLANILLNGAKKRQNQPKIVLFLPYCLTSNFQIESGLYFFSALGMPRPYRRVLTLGGAIPLADGVYNMASASFRRKTQRSQQTYILRQFQLVLNL